MHEQLGALAHAASSLDAIAEERGVAAALADLGLDSEDVRYVAEQRALRAVMVESGRVDELVALRGRLAAVQLDPDEEARKLALTSVYMDGIAIGVRFGQQSHFGVGREAGKR